MAGQQLQTPSQVSSPPPGQHNALQPIQPQVLVQSTPDIVQPTPISQPLAQAPQQLAQWQPQQMQSPPPSAQQSSLTTPVPTSQLQVAQAQSSYQVQTPPSGIYQPHRAPQQLASPMSPQLQQNSQMLHTQPSVVTTSPPSLQQPAHFTQSPHQGFPYPSGQQQALPALPAMPQQNSVQSVLPTLPPYEDQLTILKENREARLGASNGLVRRAAPQESESRRNLKRLLRRV